MTASISTARRLSVDACGFSIVEALIAAALLGTALVGLAQLFGLSSLNTATSGETSVTVAMAASKMEQLRSLSWGFQLGVPVSDVTTDTTAAVAVAGGTGLHASPENTLQRNVPGYVDYLDAAGGSMGGGAALPPGAVYVRRWFVEPLPDDPDNTLVIHVLVRRARDSNADASSRLPGEGRLTTVRARKAQ